MTAPRRWKDSADAPVGVRELLSAARPSRAMPDETRVRGMARVAKRAAVPAAAATVAALWVKLAAAGVAVAVVATGSVVAVRALDVHEPEAKLSAPAAIAPRVATNAAAAVRERAPDPETVVEPVAHLDVARVASTTVVTAPVATAPIVVSPAARAAVVDAPVVVTAPPDPPAAPKKRESSLAAELPIVEAARRAVARDPSSALASVAEHRARFPSGALSAERDLVELEALKRLGRTSEVTSLADAWLAREPAGVYATRVQALRDGR